MTDIPITEKEQLAWGSHLAPLLTCVAVSKGIVLELGVGHFSTPALHAVCGAMDRTLISVEKEYLWLEKFTYLNGLNHVLELTNDYDDYVERFASLKIGVSFIDNSPGGLARSIPFEKLLPVSEYVVVHDYHHENEDFIRPILESLKPKFHACTVYQPPTLVASLTKKIPESLLCL